MAVEFGVPLSSIVLIKRTPPFKLSSVNVVVSPGVPRRTAICHSAVDNTLSAGPSTIGVIQQQGQVWDSNHSAASRDVGDDRVVVCNRRIVHRYESNIQIRSASVAITIGNDIVEAFWRCARVDIGGRLVIVIASIKAAAARKVEIEVTAQSGIEVRSVLVPDAKGLPSLVIALLPAS